MLEPTPISASLFLAFVLLALLRLSFSRTRNLNELPTIGPSGLFTSYVGAIRLLKNGGTMVQEGYNRFHGQLFKVPSFSHWEVVCSGPDLAEDIRKAKDEELSCEDALFDIFQIKYTVAPDHLGDSYHIGVIRKALTRNYGLRFQDIHDEIVTSFGDYVKVPTTDWVKISGYKTAVDIVCRATNRLFVGLPVCRDPDYMKMNIEFTFDVVKCAHMINMFPNFLKPLVGPLLSKIRPYSKRAAKHLGPIIRERVRNEEQFGKDWSGKPNDLISWLLADATGSRRELKALMMTILSVNFVSIHTTSMTFTQALYDLALHPQYIAELREEVESIVNEDGWTKAAIDRMQKLDSFIKESQRRNGLSSGTPRKARKDFTFSNGSTVPAGTMLHTASAATHLDGALYPNPEEFDPFRFYKMRQLQGEDGKHQMTSTGAEFLAFGLGRHACPGRFFAATELKTMIAHVLLNYDVKFEREDARPPNMWMGFSCLPNLSAEVMFRKRQ